MTWRKLAEKQGFLRNWSVVPRYSTPNDSSFPSPMADCRLLDCLSPRNSYPFRALEDRLKPWPVDLYTTKFSLNINLQQMRFSAKSSEFQLCSETWSSLIENLKSGHTSAAETLALLKSLLIHDVRLLPGVQRRSQIMKKWIHYFHTENPLFRTD